ncbi:SPOSA6832_04997 [Sporobolomyces salmonicolor]|uniref:Pre-mRNA-processing factor 17 n=1 Tax=Sporidiobolus salmonicolor TaxID=5005 RepID=A0A0D6ET07_SPOSA|nr:SPOSA6832_04997 [Sporobolomyces salmonicolor]
MPLVDYGSDSDTDHHPSTQKQLPTVDDHTMDDEDDDTYDPKDAFGLARLPEEHLQLKADAQPAAGAAKQAASSAPEVISSDLHSAHSSLITRPTDNIIFYNASYSDLTRPVQGPANPWDDKRLDKQNTLTGHVEQQHFSELSFREQQRSFQVLGYAANPSLAAGTSATAPAMVGNVHEAYRNGGALVSDLKPSRAQVRATKRRRKAKGKLGEFDDPDEEGEGEEDAEGEDDEAEQEGEAEEGEEGPQPKRKKAKEQKEYLGPWAGWDGEKIAAVQPTEEEYEEQELHGGPLLNKQERRKKLLEDAGRREVGFGEEKSVFHGKETHDYLGRTYLHVPLDVEGVNLRGTPGEQECFVPKRGHTKGVSRIQLFPGSGHLVLSGSLDTRIKTERERQLWDVYQSGKCLRTFMGHSKAVHDVTFDNAGSQFLSAAFDRQMKLWDTETGQCKQAFSNGKIPYCIKFHPEQQSTFLAGMSDKKIIQYDIRSGEITQEYDQHLGPVNTITFVDENRRFISTSDDKTMRVWDFDIPVPIKLIADPTMHSMPAVGLHPNGKWLAATSLDNQIVLFGADTFKQNRKKRFAGHTIAGYACEPHFSPDGRFLSSGDGQGNLVFWDFKTSRIVSRINGAHKQVIISHAWLPHESSKVITSSWDGLIKLWD